MRTTRDATPRVLGRPRGWFSHLWMLLSFGIAGTAGQSLGFRAGDVLTLALRYGPRRVVVEGLRIVGHKPIRVSNGDDLGREGFGTFLFSAFVFLATAAGGFFLFRALLPRIDRAAFVAGHKPTSEEYDGASFLIFLGCTLWMFFTLSLEPKAIIAATMLAFAWGVDRRFRHVVRRGDS